MEISCGNGLVGCWRYSLWIRPIVPWFVYDPCVGQAPQAEGGHGAHKGRPRVPAPQYLRHRGNKMNCLDVYIAEIYFNLDNHEKRSDVHEFDVTRTMAGLCFTTDKSSIQWKFHICDMY